jgi:hypothetical protein
MSTTVTVSFGSVTFTGAQIKSARMVEEINPIATELPINTLELTLFSAEGDFSIINPSGFYANLQYKQPLDVYEDFGAGNVYMGRFYLDKWESISESLATFQAFDAMGLLDSQTYYGHLMPNFIQQSDTLIDDIESQTGLTINLDASLNNLWMNGWIPVCTFREALQLICFTLGAYATCARSNEINIIPMELASELTTYDHTIDNSMKGLGQPVALLPLVTGVEIASHLYTSNGVAEQVFDATLAAGDHRIVFDGPKWHVITVTGATEITSLVNYADINVAAAGTVTISATPYMDTTKTFSVNNSALPAGTPLNIVKISDATLVSHGPGVDIDPQDVAQRVYNYYQQRYLQKAKFYGLQVAPGDSVLIESQGAWVAGIIERMETNLTGGFVSQVEIVGVIVYDAETEESMDNFLINGSFNLAQRQTPGTLTTIAQDTYSADRWRISRENTDLQYQRNDAHAESGLASRYYGTFKKITSTGKFMVYQILEGVNSAALKGKTAIFQARMKASAAKTIKMAILELQNAGTMDTIPGTFVSAWGANTVNPTLGTNLAIITAAQSKSVTTAWQNFSVSVTVPSNSKNIIIALWSDSQFAANDILHVAEAGLYISNTVQIWKPKPYTEELFMCQRYYWKTFAIDTGPAQNVGASTSEVRFPAPVAGASTERPPKILFPALMRAAPTITTYNPAAANAQVRDFTAGADCSAVATTPHPNGVLVSCTGNASTAVGGALGVHLTAEAEL